MNTQDLLARSIGFNTPNDVKRATTSRLVYAIQPTSVTFSHKSPSKENPNECPPAHASGVNAIAIDRFEGRYLLSGGADSSIAVWDLEEPSVADDGNLSYRPLSSVKKSSDQHKLGITQVAYYPFDSLAFLTSSYDHTVKIYSSETLHVSASFDLDSVVYNIALSPIADHLLVACATQYPAVRLVDLRSGASTHSLAGHSGAVLSTAWSPVQEHLLASGATDGSVRFWDIRRSVGELGLLDLEDSIGINQSASSSFTRNSVHGKAHRGPVNGIVWTEDGRHLVTCGHDERIRVWDTNSYANTLANFGPMVRNSGLAPCIPVLPPTQFLPLEQDFLFYPNGHEILGYELFEGELVRRLKRPERQHHAPAASSGKAPAITKDRITSLSWRAHDVEMYSAHQDGSIAAWKPRTQEDADLDEEEEQEREERDVSKKRKRNALEEIYQDLTKRKITFGGI
ncbi:WD40 repeat-like protein [Aaosphaeria arxii CBS 175.79]|uniref:WD40 repeat-like protein n=1 Tax=Aaosphaeria arxii CBS 175.79 TaxID=1450172 RepID=A0A6A5XQX0_9PLEO|nr:WD40 repeat-like protein [Aaosphaeria arxii CBS 175.79]KAF2015685.1 WD40 repeat-like protein [Aaosphaeria arxii CBS 175.79]